MNKITCQHCGIHHLWTAEEILAIAKAIHVRSCERGKLDPSVLDWEALHDREKNCYLDYAVAALEALGTMLPECTPSYLPAAKMQKPGEFKIYGP